MYSSHASSSHSFLIHPPWETLIKSLSDFILEFLYNARNYSTRIASYLRRIMTKQCTKILMKSDSAIESAFPLDQSMLLQLGFPGANGSRPLTKDSHILFRIKRIGVSLDFKRNPALLHCHLCKHTQLSSWSYRSRSRMLQTASSSPHPYGYSLLPEPFCSPPVPIVLKFRHIVNIFYYTHRIKKEAP